MPAAEKREEKFMALQASTFAGKTASSPDPFRYWPWHRLGLMRGRGDVVLNPLPTVKKTHAIAKTSHRNRGCGRTLYSGGYVEIDWCRQLIMTRAVCDIW